MNRKDWYHHWFGEEYLKVYAHRDENEAKSLVNLILSQLPINENTEILDVCCGAGRHVNLLAGKGVKVTGIDLSSTLIKRAYRDKNCNAAFVQADMRYLPFGCRFDVILNLFTSFGYFETHEENLTVLDEFYRVLKHSGYFVFDYLNAPYIEENLIPFHQMRVGDVMVEQKREISNRRVNKTIRLTKDGMQNMFFESVFLYRPREIMEILADAGLKPLVRFGDYDGSEFNDQSPRLLIIGEKIG